MQGLETPGCLQRLEREIIPFWFLSVSGVLDRYFSTTNGFIERFCTPVDIRVLNLTVQFDVPTMPRTLGVLFFDGGHLIHM